jgi:hypothetical protein
VTRVFLAGSRFPVQRFDAHAFHQRAYPPAADFDARPCSPDRAACVRP